MKKQLCHILLLNIISLLIASENTFPYLRSRQTDNQDNSTHIVAIMVEFEEDNDVSIFEYMLNLRYYLINITFSDTLIPDVVAFTIYIPLATLPAFHVKL